jgi:molecular chaperone GrpE
VSAPLDSTCVAIYLVVRLKVVMQHVANSVEIMTDKKHQPLKVEAPGTTPAPDAVPLPMELPDQAIARLEAERDQLKDRYLRLAAEYENYKKRTTKERADGWVRAQAELVTRLADALDDLSRFAHVDPTAADAQSLHDGVDLVERKVWKELAALGVTRIDATGASFDPNVHEAVTTQPAASPEQDHTVGQVLQAGYRFGEVLLRPARVIVLTWQGA